MVPWAGTGCVILDNTTSNDLFHLSYDTRILQPVSNVSVLETVAHPAVANVSICLFMKPYANESD